VSEGVPNLPARRRDRTARSRPADTRDLGPTADPAPEDLVAEVTAASTPATSARGYRGRLDWTIDLVRVLAPREVRSRYRQSVLDIAWALITPISVLVVYGVVLTQSFNVSGNGTPYLSMAWSGLVLWTFFAGGIGGAAVSLIYSADLITKVYFPKEAIPLSMVGASLVDLGIGLITVAVLVPLQGIPISWTIPIAVLPLLVLVVWTAALSVLVAVVAAFIRDVPHVVQLVIRVGFFATPVMYDAESLPDALKWSATWNPVAVAIEGFRDAVLRGDVPDLALLGVQLLVGALLLVVAVRYTRAVESRLTDVV